MFANSRNPKHLKAPSHFKFAPSPNEITCASNRGDIKGFKSFADKPQILLDQAITGVVGPNGCGGSNIVDAIRWVIGEHRLKSLCSHNLEDLKPERRLPA